ncbi:MAG TPA: lysine 5,6-aminomutase subunit alpha [Candidatus Limnocylindrales bacterium]|nr:lysine 5,6-aminomutase subunit alpha [Candidatus Limnocylindrales bacterium]
MADRPIDKLAERAETLAGAWGARARASTTLGQERALLRLFGVTGLDRSGRPLAGAAVDRWLTSAQDGLGGGIALPFAMALTEYDLEPQQLALDVASGAIDLALEAELLREPERRAIAVGEADRLVGVAVDRIDADRIAGRELLDLLGEAPRPWIGTTLAEPEVDEALDEAAGLGSAGFDLLRVEVPIGRELADRMQSAGVEPPEWHPREGRGGPSRAADMDGADPAPSGSQRALARLRRAADGVAAQRRAYVRLGTAIPPLGVPEGAVVAAFERVDLVEADPVAEIVVGGVDPDRSLADHAFARRLHRRSDTFVSIGPGPLVVAPDLVSGVPSDPATRSGRALALQLLGVALARADGLSSDRMVVGAYPAWLADEPSAVARVLAEVDVRRSLFPDHIIRFDEPVANGSIGGPGAAWSYIVAAALARTGPSALLMRRSHPDMAHAASDARAAARTATEVAGVLTRRPLHGVAQDHATAMLAVAMTTLDRLSDLGWRAVVGDPPRAVGRNREGRATWAIGGDAVAERTESFDALGAFDKD